MSLSTPTSARVPEPTEKRNSAVGASRMLVKTIAVGMVNPQAGDFIPVTLTYEDGSTDSVFVVARTNGDRTEYAVGGLFFTNDGTTDQFKAWVDEAQPLIEQAIDAFAEAEQDDLPDPDEFAARMGIEPEREDEEPNPYHGTDSDA
jgi:hypothetical protein